MLVFSRDGSIISFVLFDNIINYCACCKSSMTWFLTMSLNYYVLQSGTCGDAVIHTELGAQYKADTADVFLEVDGVTHI